MNIEIIQKKLRAFVSERNWNKYHTPKNLVMALSVEVAELTEIFQWLDSKESIEILKDKSQKENIEDEVADILIYLLRFCDITNIDPEKAINMKIKKNAIKYPEDEVIKLGRFIKK